MKVYGETDNLESVLDEADKEHSPKVVLIATRDAKTACPNLDMEIGMYLEANFSHLSGYKESWQAWDTHQIVSEYSKRGSIALFQINGDVETGVPTDLEFSYKIRLYGPEAEAEAQRITTRIPQLVKQ